MADLITAFAAFVRSEDFPPAASVADAAPHRHRASPRLSGGDTAAAVAGLKSVRSGRTKAFPYREELVVPLRAVSHFHSVGITLLCPGSPHPVQLLMCRPWPRGWLSPRAWLAGRRLHGPSLGGGAGRHCAAPRPLSGHFLPAPAPRSPPTPSLEARGGGKWAWAAAGKRWRPWRGPGRRRQGRWRSGGHRGGQGGWEGEEG